MSTNHISASPRKHSISMHADISSGTRYKFRSETSYTSVLCTCQQQGSSETEHYCICTGSPEPLLLDNAISTNMSCAGSHFFLGEN